MTSGLRKAHKLIWLLLLVIVPTLMFFSIRDLDIFSSENTSIPKYDGSNKANLNSYENDVVKATVFEAHVEIILKSTLKNSSAVVYDMNKQGERSTILGQLTTAGIYNFNINNLPKGIIIYDALKEVEITKFSFKWD